MMQRCAIVLACLLMLLILWRYDFKANAKLAAHDAGTRVMLAAAEPVGHLPAPFRG